MPRQNFLSPEFRKSPPEAENILVIGCPTEPANLAPFQKCICISTLDATVMIWEKFMSKSRGVRWPPLPLPGGAHGQDSWAAGSDSVRRRETVLSSVRVRSDWLGAIVTWPASTRLWVIYASPVLTEAERWRHGLVVTSQSAAAPRPCCCVSVADSACHRCRNGSERRSGFLLGNESAPIQLAQCRFPGLAISSAKMLIYLSVKIYGSNFIKQHSETVMVWNYQNAVYKINLLCHLL